MSFLKSIRKATLEHLCKTKDPTFQRYVDRAHPEFKEIWAAIYRGVGFALVSRSYLLRSCV